MNFAAYLPILLVMLALLSHQNKQRKVIYMQQILKQTRKETPKMLELAKKFIGKECVIYSLDNQFKGKVQEVTDNAMLIEKDNAIEVINLNFVLRIKEICKCKK